MKQFKDDFHKTLHKAPVIITASSKPAYIVFPYDIALVDRQYTKEELAPNDIAFANIESVNGKPTVWARIKKILLFKVI